MRILAIVLALTFGAPAFAADAVGDARALRKKHRLEAAERVLEGVLAKDDGNLEALLEMGYLRELERDDKGALKYFGQAARAHPGSLEAQAMAVHAYVWNEDYETALDIAESAFERFGKKSPDKTLWSDLIVGLGGAQGMKADRGGIGAALKYGLGVRQTFERAVAADPEHGRALYALSRYYLQAPGIVGGDPAKGLKMLEKSIRLAPHDSRFQEVLVRELIKAGRKDDATAAYDRYKERFGDIPGAMRAIRDEAAKLQ
ncbi:MAG: tetratricopeptide repeat protein [Candidatus Sericytochromatia bacterium]|uniref:Tetratricopeptide repeat protein n=1 Tax=Candidatus Tanganyikabacteria bacterium TaxID=2961651 RepID=A0A937X1F6_9BACT|nr:tetratricopeptide repeat protein [Candidatus Tanganyikabacteria bacterium]